MDPQRNDAVILTQEFGGSSSSGVSSFQMFEDERMNIFRGAMLRKRPYGRYRPICIAYRTGRHCRGADKCPFRHEMPKTHIPPQQQRMDPQMNDAVIATQELGGSSSSGNQGASSFQMPPQD